MDGESLLINLGDEHLTTAQKGELLDRKVVVHIVHNILDATVIRKYFGDVNGKALFNRRPSGYGLIVTMSGGIGTVQIGWLRKHYGLPASFACSVFAAVRFAFGSSG